MNNKKKHRKKNKSIFLILSRISLQQKNKYHTSCVYNILHFLHFIMIFEKKTLLLLYIKVKVKKQTKK